MARSKTLPDDQVLGHVIAAMNDEGDKAVTFGLVSARCGLAPATLAQRFGTVDQMTCAAILFEWARLSEAVTAAEAEAMVSAKGSQGLLKAVPCPSATLLAASLRNKLLSDAAANWRNLVEGALASRRGGGTKGREAAALIFAAWQGRQMWDGAGGKAFRLADLLKAMP